MSRKNVTEDSQYAHDTHKRWAEHLNRDMGLPSYKDEWYAQQCFMCVYYIRLTGKLIDDWGVCSNPLSPFDRKVMFEHDGCDYFSEADVEDWGFPDASAKE